MTHVVIGYPSIADTLVLAQTMEKAGADYLEMQIPFSDPLADGPTIMQACEKALQSGLTVDTALACVAQVGQVISIPRYVMAYYNTVFRYGPEHFCKALKQAGVAGVIVPDMPIEEEPREHFFAYCKKYKIENIRVVSPASTTERLQLNAQYGSGFVYATARQGITGVGKNSELRIKNQEFSTYIKRIKKYFSIPVAVGFGISKPEQVTALEGIADIAIVGSAIIDVMNSSEKKDAHKNVGVFIKKLKGA